MTDCTNIETSMSNIVPQLMANVITSMLVCAILAVFDWRMSLAMFIMLPVSVLVLFLSRRLQSRLFSRHVEARLNAEKQTQEYLDGIKAGGERQRVSIARALLKDAPVVILDEATASLDLENEVFVQQAINRLVEGKTVLVIAHRLRTIAGADHIVVLENGKVTEQGTHEELMARNGLYEHLYSIQRKNAAWELA